METFNDNLFLLMAWVGAVSLVLVVLGFIADIAYTWFEKKRLALKVALDEKLDKLLELEDRTR